MIKVQLPLEIIKIFSLVESEHTVYITWFKFILGSRKKY